MFVTNWISTTKIQKISEITNFFRHYFLSRTEVVLSSFYLSGCCILLYEVDEFDIVFAGIFCLMSCGVTP